MKKEKKMTSNNVGSLSVQDDNGDGICCSYSAHLASLFPKFLDEKIRTLLPIFFK